MQAIAATLTAGTRGPLKVWQIGLALTLILAALGCGRLAPRAPAPASPAGSALPLSVRAPISELIGAHTAAFALREGDGAGRNAPQRFTLGFTRAGASIATSGQDLRVGVASIGGRPVTSAAPHFHGNQVSYAGRGVIELFQNGPLGLEQSFVVGTGAGAAGRRLTLVLAVSSGWKLALRDRGRVVLSRGAARIAYDGLSVRDARGARLASRLGVGHGALTITVDTRGARYPLHIDPFFQQATLAPATTTDAQYGYSLAISGSVIAVGDPANGTGPTATTDPGAVYVFSKPAGGWADAGAPAVLTPSDGSDNDRFGSSVSISSSGSTIAVGSPYHSSGGAVYVFTEPGSGGWASTSNAAELSVSGASEPVASVGFAVAISGDGSTIVAGDPDYDSSEGAAFVFTKPTSGWASSSAPAAQLAGPSTTADCPEFGSSVAISSDGGTIAVGEPNIYQAGICTSQVAGSAYVFVKPGTWLNGATPPAFPTLAPTDTLTASGGGSAGDEFGYSIAMSGAAGTIVVGAPGENVGVKVGQGAAYVITKPGAGWTGTPAALALTLPEATTQTGFGDAVSISTSGDSIAVADPTSTAQAPSAAYVYSWNGSSAGTPETAVPTSDAPVTRVAAADGTVIASSNGQSVGVFNAGLGISITSPANGVSFTQGAQVDAQFTCTPPGGATLTSCDGLVANGAPIDTSSLGTHVFSVTSTDSNGDQALATSDYTVVSASSTNTAPTSTVVTATTPATTTTPVPTPAQLAAEEAAWYQAFQALMDNPQVALNIGNILGDGGISSNYNMVPDPGLITLYANTNTVTVVHALTHRRLAASRTKRASVRVFSFSRRFAAAGHYSFKIALTSAGRRLLKAALAKHQRVTLNWTASYIPTGAAASSRSFTVHLRPVKASKKKKSQAAPGRRRSTSSSTRSGSST